MRILPLICLLLWAPAWADAKQQLEAMNKEFYQIQRVHYEENGPHPAEVLAARYLSFEQEHRGTRSGLRALLQVYASINPSLKSYEQLREHFEQPLLQHYLDSEVLGPGLSGLQYSSDGHTQTLLAKIASESSLPENRAWAGYLGAVSLLYANEDEQARKQLLEVKESYPELVGPKQKTFGVLVEAKLYALDNLQIGCEAPEIEGTDVQGEPLKLSSHRGKVVLLSFWGDW